MSFYVLQNKGYSLRSVDAAIEDALINFRIVVSPNELACNLNQLLVNSAVYRVTLIPAEPNINISQVRLALIEWVLKEDEIKLIQGSDRDEPTIKIDSSCNPIILTLEDDLCTFLQITPGGLGPSPSSLSGSGIVAVILAVLSVVLVAVVVVLAVFLYRAKHRYIVVV